MQEGSLCQVADGERKLPMSQHFCHAPIIGEIQCTPWMLPAHTTCDSYPTAKPRLEHTGTSWSRIVQNKPGCTGEQTTTDILDWQLCSSFVLQLQTVLPLYFYMYKIVCKLL
eukprot:scpid95235/ scgid33578/ 